MARPLGLCDWLHWTFGQSWMVEELIERGATVTGLVRDQVPRSRNFQENFNTKINIVHGRIEDLPTLERALAEYEIDTVFHLAAQTIAGFFCVRRSSARIKSQRRLKVAGFKPQYLLNWVGDSNLICSKLINKLMPDESFNCQTSLMKEVYL